MIVIGSVAGLTGALLIVVLAAGGIRAARLCLDPWDTHYAAMFDDLRMALVTRAVLAPSSHNEEPSLVRVDPDGGEVLYLYAESSRVRPEVGPLSRQSVTTSFPETNDAAAREVRPATQVAAGASAYAMMRTARNSRTEQVEAWMLHGAVSRAPGSRGVPDDERRTLLSAQGTYAADGSTIHMLIRLGTPTIDYPPTMRRNPNDLVFVR